MTRPVARVTNAAVIAVALWVASTAICIAGVLLGRWLDNREAAA